MGYAVEFSDVQAAAQRIAGTVKRTVVVSSEEINDIAGREVLLKCENLPVSYTHLTLPTNREV